MSTRIKKVYKSKHTGYIHNTREDAINNNILYLRDTPYRYSVKSQKVPTYKHILIPYIKEKAITLSNAGYATGAHLSTNLLDSIAKYADKVGLPIKTAIGLATKESTLGNPTDDSTFYTLFKNKEKRQTFKNLNKMWGTEQHINTGNPIDSRTLINFHYAPNPYADAIGYAASKSKTYKDYVNMLRVGEPYADKQVSKLDKNIANTTDLEAGFRMYKNNPTSYNPGQSNYVQLVNKRAEEVWQSPEIQSWYKRRLESAGKLSK